MSVSSVSYWWQIQRDLFCHFFPVYLHNLWGTLHLWNTSPGVVSVLVSIMWTLPSDQVCLRCSCQVCDLFISIPLTAVWVHGLQSGLSLDVLFIQACLPLRQNRCSMRRFALPIHVQGRKEAFPRAWYLGRENIPALQCRQRAWPSLPSAAGLLLTPAVLFPG